MAESPSLPPELGPPRPEDPQTLGRFRVVGRLGAGGMGVVYGAVDEMGRCLAVKTLHERAADDPTLRAAFAREAELLARVDGVCVPRVRAADPQADPAWMATDFVPGRTLRRHTTEVGLLDGEMLRAFAAGTAEALAAIHGCGVVHRDIKPGNVILSPEGPRVVDFGIAATVVDDQGGDDQTSDYGTPGWVAPERYAGAVPSAAADVFAWAGLVVMAATGRAPFGSGTAEELKQRVLHEEPDLDDIPAELRDLVSRALAKDPQARPEAESILGELIPAAEGKGEARRPLPELAIGLRGLLDRTWQGIDAAGHHPATWGVLAGAAGGAAVTVMASAAGVTAKAGTATGGVAGSGGITGVVAGTGATTSAGGISAATVAVTATAVVAGGAVIGAGYFAYDAYAESRALAERQEAVSAAAALLEDGEGFTAQVTTSYTGGDPGGRSPWTELYGSRGSQLPTDGLDTVLRYSAEPEPVFYVETPAAFGQEYVANVAGDVYAYAEWVPADWHQDEGAEAWEHYFDPERFTSELYSIDLLTAPLASMAASEELVEDGEADAEDPEHTVLTGSLTATALFEGEGHTQEGTGRLWLGADGSPQRLSIALDEWEVEVEFEAVDTAADLEPVQNVEHAARYNFLEEEYILTAPMCGEVETYIGAVHQVRADAWDVSCDEAMELAEVLVAGEAEEYFHSRHSNFFLKHGESVCSVRLPDGDYPLENPDLDPTLPGHLRDCRPYSEVAVAYWPDEVEGEPDPVEITFFELYNPDF